MRRLNKIFVFVAVVFYSCGLGKSLDTASAENVNRHRVLVSSDIGGTDPDDFQSMIHLFLYADTLDIEGLISSPFGPGRKEHIFQVIDQYEKDYPNLVRHSSRYPTADFLRRITRQGATDVATYPGFDKPTEGSEWIVECARRKDSRPLYVLVWGGIEDLAQALHDAPDIMPKLRVYWVGGPNKKFSPDAYQYIADHFPRLWMIESNATYRGWFTGGNQSGAWANDQFPEKYIRGKGAMGNFFMTQLGGKIKMGDTPSLAWLLNGDAEDPSKPGWGGQYVRAWERPFYHFDRMPQKTDSVQQFAIVDIALPLTGKLPEKPEAFLKVDNQMLVGYFSGDGYVRFRYSPKSVSSFNFEIVANVVGLSGQGGGVTAYLPSPDLTKYPSRKFPNWWTDDPSADVMEDGHLGIKTINCRREEFLRDFARRMRRCDK